MKKFIAIILTLLMFTLSCMPALAVGDKTILTQADILTGEPITDAEINAYMNEIYYDAPDEFSLGAVVENEDEFTGIIEQNSGTFIPFLTPYNFDGFEEYGFKTNTFIYFNSANPSEVITTLPDGEIKTYKCYNVEFAGNNSDSGMSEIDYIYLKMAVVLTIKKNAKYHDVIFDRVSPGSTVNYDMNFDGKCNLVDMLHLRKYMAELTTRVNVVEADVNDDGRINLLDVQAFRNIIVAG